MNSSTISSSFTSSCSNSIALSSITASAAKIGAPERTASAIASLGRESISSSAPLICERDLGVEGVVAQLRDGDLRDLRVEVAEDLGEQVVRHRPRGVGSLELHEDRRRLGMADPDREELVALGRLQEHDRLLADHVEAHSVDDHLLHGQAEGIVAAALRPARPCATQANRPGRGSAPGANGRSWIRTRDLRLIRAAL